MIGLLNLGAAHQPLAQLIHDQLEQVSLIFERQLASDISAVNKLCLHVEHYRGKMLRPMLVLLSGLAGIDDLRLTMDDSAAGPDPNRQSSIIKRQSHCSMPPAPASLTERHRTLAAVVEMIHMATLVHDDVLDEADLRRGGETVNHLWGNETAVILGDYLISNAFHLCSTLGDPTINLALGEVTNTLCSGELVQLHHRNDYSIDEATYLEIVRRKTASLIGECCRLGALLSGAGAAQCEALKRFGASLGLAFQIQDDLLDLVGDPTVLGKPRGQDLEKGKLTLPVIYYLAQAEVRERGEALRLIAAGDVEALRQRLTNHSCVWRTTEAALALIDQAKGELGAIAAGPARDLLAAMADNVVDRKC